MEIGTKDSFIIMLLMGKENIIVSRRIAIIKASTWVVWNMGEDRLFQEKTDLKATGKKEFSNDQIFY